MATEIISDDLYKGHTVETLFGAALAALQEQEDQLSVAYCVATAGRCLCGEQDITHGRVFEAIEQLLESTACIQSLRRYVTEIASRANVGSTLGARHG